MLALPALVAPRRARRRAPQHLPVLTVRRAGIEACLNGCACALVPDGDGTADLLPPTRPGQPWRLDCRPRCRCRTYGRGLWGCKGLLFRAPHHRAALFGPDQSAHPLLHFVLVPDPTAAGVFCLQPLQRLPTASAAAAAPAPRTAASYWASKPPSVPMKQAPSTPDRPFAPATIKKERAAAAAHAAKAAQPYRNHPTHTNASFAALPPPERQRIDHACNQGLERRSVQAPDGSRYTVLHRADQTGSVESIAPTR